MLLLAIALLACNDTTQDLEDTAPLGEEIACPDGSGFTDVGAWWTYQELDSVGYAIEGETTVTAMDEADGALLVTVEASVEMQIDSTIQIRDRTLSYRCDAEGLWILEEQVDLYVEDGEGSSETSFGTVWHQPELLLTRTLEPGDSWSTTWSKSFGGGEPTEGTTQVRVLDPAELTVPAGTFEVLGIERTYNGNVVPTDLVAPGVGVVLDAVYGTVLVDFG